MFEFATGVLNVRILDEFVDEIKNPYLSIVYDTYSKAVCSFYISFEPPTLDDALQLFRAAILEDAQNSFSVYGKPKEYVINDIRVQEKKRLEEIKRELDMEINFSSGENKMSEFYRNNFV